MIFMVVKTGPDREPDHNPVRLTTKTEQQKNRIKIQ
jgi:hypothetical protein